MSETSTQLRPLRWQGLRLDLPDRWDPVKLEGDADGGMILLADLHRPRLGVRWKALKKKADPAKSVDAAMRDEVGALAADEATLTSPNGDWEFGQLYTEPETPGRDVWIGVSRVTRRLVQVIYHAHHRDRMLADSVLPTLGDNAAGEWSIFDLSCRLPAGAKLIKHRLNVGDLTLEFEIDRKPLIVRQIAVASVALTRQPIERWLASQQLGKKKFYRPTEQPQPVEIAGLKGIRRTMVRRRRHFLMRSLHKLVLGVALRDESRDKLLILESPDLAVITDAVKTIGWATKS